MMLGRIMRYGSVIVSLMLSGCAMSGAYKGEYESDRFFRHLMGIPQEMVDDENPPSIQCDGASHDLAEVLRHTRDAISTRIRLNYPREDSWMRHELTIAHVQDVSQVDWIQRVTIEAEDEIHDAIVLRYFDTYPDPSDQNDPEFGYMIGATLGVDVVVVPCIWDVIDVYDWSTPDQ